VVPLPETIADRVAAHTWRPVRAGKSGAEVYELTGPGSHLFLKVERLHPARDPLAEADRLRWLAGRQPVPAVVGVEADQQRSYLLTAALPGSPASDPTWTSQPARCAALLGRALRQLHDLPVDGCPFDTGFDAELRRATSNVAHGLVDAAHFDPEHQGRTPASLLAELSQQRPTREERVLIHGDASLKNFVIDDWRLSGMVDLGRFGVGDRYHDLAQALRSIRKALGPPALDDFVAAYRLSAQDEERLATYRLLDELF